MRIARSMTGGLGGLRGHGRIVGLVQELVRRVLESAQSVEGAACLSRWSADYYAVCCCGV